MKTATWSKIKRAKILVLQDTYLCQNKQASTPSLGPTGFLFLMQRGLLPLWMVQCDLTFFSGWSIWSNAVDKLSAILHPKCKPLSTYFDFKKCWPWRSLKFLPNSFFTFNLFQDGVLSHLTLWQKAHFILFTFPPLPNSSPLITRYILIVDTVTVLHTVHRRWLTLQRSAGLGHHSRPAVIKSVGGVRAWPLWYHFS